MQQFLQANQDLLYLVQRIGEALWAEGAAIGRAIAGLVLVAELTFAGFRVIFGQPLGKELFEVTRKAVLIGILVFAAWPQKLIYSAMTGLTQSGRTLGAQILALCPSGFTGTGNPSGGATTSPSAAPSTEPPEYWFEWIRHTPGATTAGGGYGGANHKFSIEWIATNILGLREWVQSTFNLLSKAVQRLLGSEDSEPTPGNEKPWFLKIGRTFGNGLGALLNVVTNLKDALLGIIILAALLIASIFTAVLSLVIIAALLFFAVLMMLGTLLGSQFGFFVCMGMGVAVLPLMFFKSMERMWQEYLAFLVSCVLAMYFYYIFSACGLVLVDGIITYVFAGTGGGNGPFPTLIGALIKMQADHILPGSVAKFLEQVLGSVSGTALGGLAAGIADPSVKWVQVFILIGGWIAGAAILSTLITSGVSLAALAIPMGFSWRQAFANQALVDTVHKTVTGLQGALATAVGISAQLIIGAVMSVFSFGAGAVGGLMGGRLGRLISGGR